MNGYILEYRTYARKIKVNGTEYYAKVVIRKEKSKKLKLHDVDITEIKNETSGSRNGGAENNSASNLDKLVSVKNSIPWWLNEVKTKLIDVDKVQQNNNNTLNQSTNIVEPSNGMPYVSNKSYRCTNGEAISSYTGYAMFADYAPATDMYGDNLYTVNHADLTDIDEIKPKIAAAWDEAAESGRLPVSIESLADKYSGKEIAEDFDPSNIVDGDGAGAWDIPELVS